MTIPFKSKPQRPSGADNAQRRRIQGIQQLASAYEGGAAQSDFDTRPAEEALDATKDYDLFQRMRRKVKFPSPSKPK